MLQHQEHLVAGHSTGISWKDSGGVHLRRAVGKVNSFLKKYPDKPRSNLALGHSRYATVGAVNEQNQHPIKIFYKGKRIGYGVHNGTFRGYQDYEYLRNNNLSNKTDSALLFTLYSQMLEKIGNTPESRRQALAKIQEVAGGSKENPLQNIIIVFDDGQVLFSGHTLTYAETNESFGIMTFGLEKKADPSQIYDVMGFHAVPSAWHAASVEVLPKPKPVEEAVLERGCPVNIPVDQRHLDEFELSDERPRRIVGRYFKRKGNAKGYAEMMKRRTNANYRVEPRRDGWVVKLARAGEKP